LGSGTVGRGSKYERERAVKKLSTKSSILPYFRFPIIPHHHVVVDFLARFCPGLPMTMFGVHFLLYLALMMLM
jgi:hypothetical protein